MAAHCRNILGDAIVADPLETHPVSVPSTYFEMYKKGKNNVFQQMV